jgi:hypothetical protein
MAIRRSAPGGQRRLSLTSSVAAPKRPVTPGFMLELEEPRI